MSQSAEVPHLQSSGSALLVALVLPFVLYVGLASLEPVPPSAPDTGSPAAAVEPSGPLGLAPQHYPVAYAGRAALVAVVLACFASSYRSAFRWNVSPAAVAVGAVGAVIWVALAKLHLEGHLLAALNLRPDDWLAQQLGFGERPSFNPLAALADQPTTKWLFLAARLAGLAIVVPLAEELFLRGFVMRFATHDNWAQVPLAGVNRLAIIVGTALPMLYHPEKLASLVWFSMVTWLMLRTGSMGNCVVAHAVTNLLLGIFVLVTGSWELW